MRAMRTAQPFSWSLYHGHVILYIGHTNAAARGCETYPDLGRLKRARVRGLPSITIIRCACLARVSHKCTYHVPWDGAPSALPASVPDPISFRTFRYAL